MDYNSIIYLYSTSLMSLGGLSARLSISSYGFSSCGFDFRPEEHLLTRQCHAKIEILDIHIVKSCVTELLNMREKESASWMRL